MKWFIQSQKVNTSKVILRKKYLNFLMLYPQNIFKTFKTKKVYFIRYLFKEQQFSLQKKSKF